RPTTPPPVPYTTLFRSGGAAPMAGGGAASALLLMWALPAELRRAKGGQVERARLARYAAYGLPLSLSLVMSLALATTDRFVLARSEEHTSELQSQSNLV